MSVLEVAQIQTRYVFFFFFLFFKKKNKMEPEIAPHPASTEVVDFADWASNATSVLDISLGNYLLKLNIFYSSIAIKSSTTKGK